MSVPRRFRAVVAALPGRRKGDKLALRSWARERRGHPVYRPLRGSGLAAAGGGGEGRPVQPEDLTSPAAGRLRSAPSVRSVSLGAMSRESASLLSLSPSERLGLPSGSAAVAGGAPTRWAAGSGSGSGGGSLSFWACASLECRHFIRRFWNHTFTCGRAALRRAARPPPRTAHRTAHRPSAFNGDGQRGGNGGAVLTSLCPHPYATKVSLYLFFPSCPRLRV